MSNLTGQGRIFWNGSVENFHFAFQQSDWLEQTWVNFGPRAKSGPPVLIFWPAGTYTNLNSHHELSERPFFSLGIMDGSDFQTNKPQQCSLQAVHVCARTRLSETAHTYKYSAHRFIIVKAMFSVGKLRKIVLGSAKRTHFFAKCTVHRERKMYQQ